MAVASTEELRLAFEDADPTRILGTLESGWVDFKSQPYLLSTDRGAWELCKDVAGLANANGGCIVIGIATEKDENDASERAHALRPVPAAMCNRDQHRDRIAAGIFPLIDGLQLAAYPSSTEGSCYFVFYVPAQSADLRPFLVRYLLGADDRRVNGFGWPVRVDDAITWARLRAVPKPTQPRRPATDCDGALACATEGRALRRGTWPLYASRRSDGRSRSGACVSVPAALAG